MSEIHCRHFTGYKPCSKNETCDSTCPSRSLVGETILIVHLEALGAVLRSTSLIAGVRRKHPRAMITWVTKAPAHALLQGAVDRVLTTSAEDLLKLLALEFDVAYVIDKSLAACGVLHHTRAKSIQGFRADTVTGAIVPATREADELWRLGLSDQKKFFENRKTEQQLVHEALNLGDFKRDEYAVHLSAQEKELALVRRELWARGAYPILGLNTGCSGTLPHKKLSIDGHRHLIAQIQRNSELKGCPIVLLGGPEDTERNEAIAQGFNVIQSPTQRGLRDGLASVAACDLVFTGDSLGMHMAIALRKWVVAWFGPSCEQEVDLYGRGEKILTQATCSPCWKRACEKPVMCYDQVDFAHVQTALVEGLKWHISSSKPHFQETFSSQFL